MSKSSEKLAKNFKGVYLIDGANYKYILFFHFDFCEIQGFSIHFCLDFVFYVQKIGTDLDYLKS